MVIISEAFSTNGYNKGNNLSPVENMLFSGANKILCIDSMSLGAAMGPFR